MRVALAIATALGGLVGAPGAAHAEPGSDRVISEPDPRGRARDASGPDTLYLNRCVGGCAVTRGSHSAVANRSSIIEHGGTLAAFPHGDAAWDAVVACVEETFAPYGVEVVTTEPSGDHVEVMVAGEPADLGFADNVFGMAPLASDCSPQVDWIGFAFAAAHDPEEVLRLCATVAHEAGHVYGLDHAYDCLDPMTYLLSCGRKWFLNVEAECGELDGPRPCQCTGPAQNTHAALTLALGAGELPPGPEVTILYPADGEVVDGWARNISVEINDARFVEHVEFWLNGWRESYVEGQRTQRFYSYGLVFEPDGIIDLEVRAYNDLGVATTRAITFTKGAPCVSADTCREGQICDDGHCTWPPPSGELGDDCASDRDCISGQCAWTEDFERVCQRPCVVGIEGGCDDGEECVDSADDDGGGVCRLAEPAGCCSAGGGGGLPAGGLAGLIGLLLARRRGRS